MRAKAGSLVVQIIFIHDYSDFNCTPSAHNVILQYRLFDRDTPGTRTSHMRIPGLLRFYAILPDALTEVLYGFY